MEKPVATVAAVLLVLFVFPVWTEASYKSQRIRPIMWQRGTGLAAFLTDPFRLPADYEQ
jgi:hypothetical protein